MQKFYNFLVYFGCIYRSLELGIEYLVNPSLAPAMPAYVVI